MANRLNVLIRDFACWLRSENGQELTKTWDEKRKQYLELLKDEAKIEALSEDEVVKIFANLWSARKWAGKKIVKDNGLEKVKKWLRELIRLGERGLSPTEFDDLLGGLKGGGHAMLSELLCLRFPERYWIWNKPLEEATEKLKEQYGVLDWEQLRKGTKGEKYFAFREVLDRILSAMDGVPEIEQTLGREPNYYSDADMFLFWIAKKEEGKLEEGKLEEYFKARGFHFTDEQIATFYAALKTKGFVILSGLSGTGKTKLAELFAELFAIEQEVEEETQEVSETDIVLGVQPYMLKYKRFIIPVHYWEMLQPLDIGEEIKVEVVAGEAREHCKLKRWEHPANPQGYMQLLLRGKVAHWFAENLQEGDRFKIEPLHDDDGNLQSLTFTKLEKRKVKRPQPVHLFLSVRPDWRDSKALLGYYNPLTEQYESTPLLRFLLRARNDYEKNRGNAQPYFVILDEMNLSHVEYYFADFLSVLESGRDENGWTKEPLRLYSPDLEKRPDIEQEQGIPPELHLPPNLYIIGTVNIDETTYMFSPKVLDRAFTIEFRDVDFSNYPSSESGDVRQIADRIREAILNDLRNGSKFCSVTADKNEIKQAVEGLGGAKQQLEKLNSQLQSYDLHFGYRVLDEIALFVKHATDEKLPDQALKLSPEKALDYAVLMKVLPKFHGPRQKLEMPLWYVVDWCLNQEQKQSEQQGTGEQFSPQSVWKHIKEDRVPSHADIATLLRDWGEHENKFRYPATAKKALQMLRQLYETGFASFAQ